MIGRHIPLMLHYNTRTEESNSALCNLETRILQEEEEKNYGAFYPVVVKLHKSINTAEGWQEEAELWTIGM